MALGAIFCNDIGQAYDQYSAGESGTSTPIYCDAISKVNIVLFKIGISLFQVLVSSVNARDFLTPPALHMLDMHSQVL